MPACAPGGKAAHHCGSRRAEAATSLRFDRWRRLKASLRLLEWQRRSGPAMQALQVSRRTASMMGLSKTSSTNLDRREHLRWLASAAEAPSGFDRTASKSAPLRPTSQALLRCYTAGHAYQVAAHDNPCSYSF